MEKTVTESADTPGLVLEDVSGIDHSSYSVEKEYCGVLSSLGKLNPGLDLIVVFATPTELPCAWDIGNGAILTSSRSFPYTGFWIMWLCGSECLWKATSC